MLGRLPQVLSLARESFLGRLIVKCGLAGCVSKSFIGQKQEEEEEGKPKGCKGSRPASSLSSVTASTFLRFSLFRSSVWLLVPLTPPRHGFGGGWLHFICESEKLKHC